jgi:hypothetical protein
MTTEYPDGFNLRALIREVCESSTIADPATLAKEVSRRIGRNQQREALEQALPVLVQHVISRSRGGFTDTPSGHRAIGAQTSRAAGGQPSRKVAAIRETWRRMLRDRVAVGPDRGDWKFLGDCTDDDLAYAEQIRRDHARANTAAADRLVTLRGLLAEHGAATVAELPDGVLADNLAAAA